MSRAWQYSGKLCNVWLTLFPASCLLISGNFYWIGDYIVSLVSRNSDSEGSVDESYKWWSVIDEIHPVKISKSGQHVFIQMSFSK